MSAIAGTFSDIKTIKSRSVVQLCIEVPIERADEALSILGGVPQPGRERWVGIAPIPDQERPALPPKGCSPIRPDEAVCNIAPEAASPGGALPRGADGAAKPKKRWADMPIAQRAALVCSDPQSWPILGAMADLHEMPETDQQAAQALRRLCGVFSRAEIAAKPAAFAKYMKFETEYMRATGRIASPA